MWFDLLHPRQQLVQIMDRIYRCGLTATSGRNLSIRDENGDLWITPAAVDKGNLQPRDIMVLTADGQVSGPHAPSSERPFHGMIYAQRPDVRAIVHAHSPALVSFSIAQSPNAMAYAVTGQPLDNKTIPESYVVLRTVPLVPHGKQYDTPEQIAAAISKNSPVLLIENDRGLATGTSAHQAFDRLEVADFTALALINTRPIGPLVPIGEAEVRDLEEKFG
jgi:L-fuculose-phosphate aldolase